MRLGWAKALDRVLGRAMARLVGLGDALTEALCPPGPVGEVRHLAVVKLWGLGNWALLRPVVRDLRARWPAARLTLVTLAPNAPLVRDLADEVLLVRPDGPGAVLRDLLVALARLRRARVDLAIDFEQFAHAGALLLRLGGARQRVGFRTGAAGRDGLHTVLVPRPDDRHAARAFRDLVEAAGVPPAPYRPGHLEPSGRGRAEVLALGLAAPVVVLHPGSGDNFPGRRWSESSFAAVGRLARARGLEVVVTGSAGERELAARVAEGAGGRSTAGRLSVEGLVALLAGARAVVTNDTGPVHIASALGTPVLAIYGPNTPVRYGPLSAGSRAFWRRLPCSPCLTEASYRSSRCRIPTCTASVPTGEVAAALARILEGSPDAGAEEEATWRGETS